MSSSTAEMLEAQARAQMRGLEFLEALAAGEEIDAEVLDDYGYETVPDLWDAVDAEVLDLYGIWHGRPGGGLEYAGAVLLLCTGGPHVEAAIDGSGAATITGHWGGDRVTLYTDASALGEALEAVLLEVVAS